MNLISTSDSIFVILRFDNTFNNLYEFDICLQLYVLWSSYVDYGMI